MQSRFKVKLVYYLGFMILGVIFGFWVVKLEARIVKKGFEIAKIDNNQKRLMNEKKQLKDELARLNAPENIRGQLSAIGLDMRPMESVNALAQWEREGLYRQRRDPRTLVEFSSSRAGRR